MSQKILIKAGNVTTEGVLNDRWMQTSPAMRRMLARPWFRRKVAEAARKSMVAGKSVGKLGDVPTAEYARNPRLRPEPWEAVRSIGNSFGYNEQESSEDHLTGDVYFRIRREGHNLDRARAQLRLAERMLEHADQAREIVERAATG